MRAFWIKLKSFKAVCLILKSLKVSCLKSDNLKANCLKIEGYMVRKVILHNGLEVSDEKLLRAI